MDQKDPSHPSPLVSAALHHPVLLPCLLAAGADPREVWHASPGFELDAPTALVRNWFLSDEPWDDPEEGTPAPPSAEALASLLHHLLAAGAPVDRVDAYLTEQSAFTDEAAHLAGALARARTVLYEIQLAPGVGAPRRRL